MNTSSIPSSTIIMSSFNLGGGDFSTPEIAVLLSLVITLIIFAISSNSFVIYAVSTYRPLMSPSNLYLVSLAITDLLCAILLMPVAAYYNVVGVWYFGTFGCQMWLYGTYFLCTSSIYHLCVIALDRYRAIIDPLTYAKSRSNKKTILTVSLVWIYSMLIAIPPFASEYGWTFPETFQNDTPCVIPQNISLAIYAWVGGAFIPLMVIILIYVKLYRINRERLQKKMDKSASKINRMEKDILLLKGNNSSKPNLENKNVVDELASNHSNLKHFNSSPCINVSMVSISTRCLHCNVGIFTSYNNIKNLCQICSVPNDIILAAERSRLDMLLQKERRFMFIISVILCTFFCCMIPTFPAYIVANQYPSIKINKWLMSLAWWLIYANSACNPVIYTIFNRDFRDAFNKICGLN